MRMPNAASATGLTLRVDALLDCGPGRGCRVLARDAGQDAEIVAIGQVWARVRVVSGQEFPEPGEEVALEPGLPGEPDLSVSIPCFVIDRLDDELWLRFTVSLPDLQPSRESCAVA